jgi:hypothetical protein
MQDVLRWCEYDGCHNSPELRCNCSHQLAKTLVRQQRVQFQGESAHLSVRVQLARLWASPDFWRHCRERGLSDADLHTLEQQLAVYRVGACLLCHCHAAAIAACLLGEMLLHVFMMATHTLGPDTCLRGWQLFLRSACIADGTCQMVGHGCCIACGCHQRFTNIPSCRALVLQRLRDVDRAALRALCRQPRPRCFECRRPPRWLLAAEHLAGCAVSLAAGGTALGVLCHRVSW